jgi:DNA mismatch repair protein MutS2
MSYSLETLEYGKLLELISRHAQTPMGVERFADLRPIEARAELESSLAAISETITLNEEKQVTWSFSGLEDPSNAVAILKIRNSTVEPLLLLEISRVCNQALFARSSIQPEKENSPTLWSIVEKIPPTLLGAIDLINKKLLPGGEIDDAASPELAAIRRDISTQKARLTRVLESAMRAAGTAIQDEIVTVRNDRFVIPVKTDFKGKVTGVAHGYSSSGQTVYVEPLEVIEANNELQNLRGKEEREVARILFDLSERLREQLPAVEAAVDAVAELDFIKGKVEFARKFNAVVPEITDDNTLDLVDARHPLLSEPPASAGGQFALDHVVPNSFRLDSDNAIMIISGANAGGKTVVLKTAGLLSLMAISGLPVPANEARIPFYRSVLADIGDHQSLSANLSTFSSHMSNIASMIGECRPPSLVLLDEAGTGTDPEEGSALGVAIVDHFRSKGAQVVASTHYRGLKMYAANDPTIINASVEFDEKTLQPTYKLLIGLAGASSGIEIARRFGIDQTVIDAARANLDVSAQEAENYLKKLQTETKIATDLRIALEDEREAVAMKYAGLEVDAVKKEKARQREFESALAQSVEEFDRQSQAFLKTIEDKALKNKLDKERLSRKAELNRAVVSKVQGPRPKAAEATAETRAVASVPDQIEIGSNVITSFGKTGVVQRIDGEVVQVLVGNVHIREKLADLLTADVSESKDQSTKPKAGQSMSSLDLGRETLDQNAELNLIGQTTADAEYELDRFLDEAYMSGTPRVRIIHGFGTGALKNYVHHFLKNSDLVEKHEFAPSNQGGNGATIAFIKL